MHVSKEKIEYLYDDQNNEILNLKIKVIRSDKKLPLDKFIKHFENMNEKATENITVTLPQFGEIPQIIFDEILNLENQENFKCALSLTEKYFSSFTNLSEHFLNQGRTFISMNLWQHIILRAWKWEDNSRETIHKGTPYFFAAKAMMMQGNIDVAFLFLFNALEEDKLLSKKLILCL